MKSALIGALLSASLIPGQDGTAILSQERAHEVGTVGTQLLTTVNESEIPTIVIGGLKATDNNRDAHAARNARDPVQSHHDLHITRLSDGRTYTSEPLNQQCLQARRISPLASQCR